MNCRHFMHNNKRRDGSQIALIRSCCHGFSLEKVEERDWENTCATTDHLGRRSRSVFHDVSRNRRRKIASFEVSRCSFEMCALALQSETSPELLPIVKATETAGSGKNCAFQRISSHKGFHHAIGLSICPVFAFRISPRRPFVFLSATFPFATFPDSCTKFLRLSRRTVISAEIFLHSCDRGNRDIVLDVSRLLTAITILIFVRSKYHHCSVCHLRVCV